MINPGLLGKILDPDDAVNQRIFRVHVQVHESSGINAQQHLLPWFGVLNDATMPSLAQNFGGAPGMGPIPARFLHGGQ